MDVTDSKSARQLVNAWTGHPAAGHLLAGFADDQRHCANLATQLRRPGEAKDHREAADVLDRAVEAIARKRNRYAVIGTSAPFLIVDSADPCGYGVEVDRYQSRDSAKRAASLLNGTDLEVV